MSGEPSVDVMVYLKIHEIRGEKIVAICDADLLGKRVAGRGMVLKVDERFYGGELVPLEYALDKAEEASIVNIIGERAVEGAIRRGLVHPAAVLRVGGVPHAQVVKMKLF